MVARLRRLARVWGVCAATTLPAASAGCVQVGLGTGGDGGAGAVQAIAGMGDGGGGGTQCSTDPASGITLCAFIDLCPGVEVDPAAFPNCGFRLHGGSALDLECLCSDALCPLGVPTTCEQAAQLLGAQSALLVCDQEVEGRCVSLGGSGAGTGGGSTPSGTGAGTCDRECESGCAGAPACIQLCGC